MTSPISDDTQPGTSAASAPILPDPNPEELREKVAAIINAAVGDLTIQPHWFKGQTPDECRLISDAFQNGVEVASDAILSALQHDRGEG